MQNVHLSVAQAPAMQAREHFAAAQQPLVYRRLQSTCNDAQFIAALNAYRKSGGLAPAEELLASLSARCPNELSALARWIVAGQVISFSWQARTWLPKFQFCRESLTPRRDLEPVLARLSEVCDDWQAAQWFATHNPWLGNRTPVDVVASDVPAVMLAARAIQPFSAPEHGFGVRP